MKIAFAGTPPFAATALKHIAAHGFKPSLVLTQPDRPAGRGNKLQMSAVKAAAMELGVAVHQPTSLRLDGRYPQEAAAAQQVILDAQLDVMIVAAYGLLLPQWVLDAPRYGCINIHGSLLPRWRGAAPIQRALEAGDVETGVTLMQMDIGLDTGAMIEIQRTAIGEEDTSASLYERLAELGAAMTLTELGHLARGTVRERRPQPEGQASYAKKIDKSEAALDLQQSAHTLARKIRAFNPAPGCVLELNGKPFKVWHACARDQAHTSPAGTLVRADSSGVYLACGQGVLVLTELQQPGGRRLSAAEAAQGLSA